MTASDHLSVTQFGFHKVDYDQFDAALMHGFTAPTSRGRIRVDSDLHTGQDYVHQSGVDHFVANPRAKSETDVEIYHHEGKQFIGDGHHRVAAARVRGQKTISVTHYGKTT